MRAAGWYGRPVAALCVTASALAVSAMLLCGAEFGPRESASKAVYAITIRHQGVDARQMERSVAIPLEDVLASAAGASGTSSTSEYGMTRVIVHFSGKTDPDMAYAAVRDAAQLVYEQLPRSAQRPEIATSSEGSGPAWVAAVCASDGAVASIGRLLEQTVRPALEKLPGAGEVDIAGTGIPEVLVDVDEAAASMVGLEAAAMAGYMSGSDRYEATGSLLSGGTELRLAMDSRYTSLAALRRATIPIGSGGVIPVGNLATLAETDRPPQILSRINGQRAVTIAVSPGGQANLPALSRGIAAATAALAREWHIEFQVLYDAGAQAAASFNSMLGAMLQGAVGVALATALLLGSTRTPSPGIGRPGPKTVAVLAVPMILVMSAAALVACGLSLDRHGIAGLAAGLGASVDAAIIVAQRLGSADSIADGREGMRRLVPSLLAGNATTVVVLVPLAGLDFIAEGAARIAAAIAIINGMSLLVALVLMPPLMLARCQPARPGHGAAQRAIHRLIAIDARLCHRKPAAVVAISMALGCAGVLAMLSSPMQTGLRNDGATIEAHIEFESGTAAECVDTGLALWAKALGRADWVNSVYTTARRGYGTALVGYDPGAASRSRVCAAMRNSVPAGAFVWIPEPDAQERSFQVVVSGDDDAECRVLATAAASRLASLPFVLEAVLEFKDGPADIVVRPDRERLAAAGVSFSDVALTLRQSVQGPVAYKRLERSGQTDVRFLSSVAASVQGLGAIPVSTVSGMQPLGSLTLLSRERDTARIYRSDRRRIASISLRTRAIDPRSARDAVYARLEAVPRPDGYAFEFDRDALESAQRLSGSLGSFLFAALLAYIVTAAVSESLTVPLAVMLSLPPSLALPALVLALAGVPLDAFTACAFVAVCGIVVNASILTVDQARSRDIMRGAKGNAGGDAARVPVDSIDLYNIIRSRFATLAATSGTTVAGALPFLLLGSADAGMARSLSFVSALGTAASFVVSITLVPSLAVLAPGWFGVSRLSTMPLQKGESSCADTI